MKTGDAIAKVAQPIAKTLDWALGTNIQGCQGCHQMHLNLNAGMSLADAFYDRFWKTRSQRSDVGDQMSEVRSQKEKQTMQYIVNKTHTEQIAIDAENPKEAMEKVRQGEGTLTATNETFNVQPRPGQPPQVR